MEKFVMMEELGRGSYGIVWKAFNKNSGEFAAIKKLTRTYYKSWDECMNLIEVKALVNNNHPNIVKLKEIVKQNSTLFLVFEYMECDVYSILDRKRLSETTIRNMCFQVLQGLASMHRNGYIHRDLKPANLLVYQDLVKIGDFGLARETKSKQPYTHNVTTEAYRAPEVFLRSPTYDSAIDMWAMGVIMTELFTNKSLFRSCETHGVLANICSVLGTPTETTWLSGLEFARNMYYEFPKHPGVQFSSLLPKASSDAVNLISSLLSWDPSGRPTAKVALQHPFFHGCYGVPPAINGKYTGLNSLHCAPPGFENLMHPKLHETECLETCKGGYEDIDLEDLACLLPRNLFDF